MIKSDKIFYTILILLNLFVLAYSPIAWRTDYTRFFPLGIANYFNKMNGSLFPLFPWLAFIFTGALTGKYYIETVEKIGEKIFLSIYRLQEYFSLLPEFYF